MWLLKNNKGSANNDDEEHGAFRFNIETVHSTMVSGHIIRGKVKVGDTVQIIGMNNETLTTKVTKISKFAGECEEAVAPDLIGLTLKDITKDQVQVGQVVAKPNSIVATTKFDADVYVRTEEEQGGIPLADGHKLNFAIENNIKIKGTYKLPDGVKIVMPGNNTSISVTLTTPIAVDVGDDVLITNDDRKRISIATVTKVY